MVSSECGLGIIKLYSSATIVILTLCMAVTMAPGDSDAIMSCESL